MNPIDRFSLEGKTALITGGARGIGHAVAMGLAQSGANLWLVDIREAAVTQTAAKIRQETGRQVSSFSCDVADPESVKALMKAVDSQGETIDVAFLNAGVAANEPAETMAHATWQKVIDVNLTGVFLTAQAVGGHMIRKGIAGSIIATASMSGHVVNVPQPQCAYNASKAGVIMLVKSLAVEWAQHRIRVNSISPGYVGTEMTRQRQEWLPQWQEKTPLGRLARPEELIGTVLYLASEASSFTTGSDLIVDGAYTCV